MNIVNGKQFKRLRVLSIGMYVPERVVQNSEFDGKELFDFNLKGEIVSKGVITSSEWIEQRTGVKQRHYASTEQQPSDLAYNAAREAINRANIDPKSIEAIIFATVTQTENVPNAGSRLQETLGLDCYVYDVQNACSGLTLAFHHANSFAKSLAFDSFQPKNYLVVASECLSKIVDERDKSSPLFGDGAAAFVLTPVYDDDPRGILSTYVHNRPHNGNFKDFAIDKTGKLRMNGKAVMKRAIPGMVDALSCAKQLSGLERLDVALLHQANKRIIDGAIPLILKENPSCIVPSNIDRYANTSAASTGILYHNLVESGVIIPGMVIGGSSFGAGDSLGAYVMRV